MRFDAFFYDPLSVLCLGYCCYCCACVDDRDETSNRDISCNDEKTTFEQFAESAAISCFVTLTTNAVWFVVAVAG